MPGDLTKQLLRKRAVDRLSTTQTEQPDRPSRSQRSAFENVASPGDTQHDDMTRRDALNNSPPERMQKTTPEQERAMELALTEEERKALIAMINKSARPGDPFDQTTDQVPRGTSPAQPRNREPRNMGNNPLREVLS